MGTAGSAGSDSAWGISGARGSLPVAGAGWGDDGREFNAGPVRVRYHRGYWAVLVSAWAVYLISMGLPTMYLDSGGNYGWEAFWIAGWACVMPIDPAINAAAWVGTLSNVVMLVLTPIFRAGGKQPGKERFFDVAALISGAWVWGIVLLFGLNFFTVGYYVWCLTHLAVGTRIFWRRVYFDKLGELPPGVKRRGDRPPAGSPAPRAVEDWPKDQAGGWDEGGKKNSKRAAGS